MKKRKPTKAEREAMANWEKLNAKWDAVPKFAKRPVSLPPDKPQKPIQLKVAVFVPHDGTMKPNPQYTGNAVLGISTLHKSNQVPVFSREEAIDISKMRRN